MGYGSVAFCSFHMSIDYLTYGNKTKTDQHTPGRGKYKKYVTRSWILIFTGGMAMQLPRKHTGKNEERGDLSTLSGTQCTFL